MAGSLTSQELHQNCIPCLDELHHLLQCKAAICTPYSQPALQAALNIPGQAIGSLSAPCCYSIKACMWNSPAFFMPSETKPHKCGGGSGPIQQRDAGRWAYDRAGPSATANAVRPT